MRTVLLTADQRQQLRAQIDEAQRAKLSANIGPRGAKGRKLVRRREAAEKLQARKELDKRIAARAVQDKLILAQREPHFRISGRTYCKGYQASFEIVDGRCSGCGADVTA